MDTIFMNSENSKTSKSHVLVLKVTNEISATTWIHEFELPDGLYFASHIFQIVLNACKEKHGEAC